MARVSQSRCITCNRPADRLTCQDCESKAGTNLQWLGGRNGLYAKVYEHSSELLEPGSFGPSNGGKSSKLHAPLGVRVGVLNLLGSGGVLSSLRRWTLIWYTDLGTTPPAWVGDEITQVRTASGDLIRKLPWAAGRRWDFEEFSKDILTMVNECRMALDPEDKPEPRSVRVGLCPGCGKHLYARLGQTSIDCKPCAKHWSMAEWPGLAR